MLRLILATRNAGKTREVREILGEQYEIEDLTSHPEIPEIEETGKTFAENAKIKALAVAGRCDELVLADDSGLEVDALGGAPGVYSARYSGENATDAKNIEKLRDNLANTCIEQRTARFRCVIVIAQKNEVVATFDGAVEGRIIDQPRGTGGFGYDPIFLPNGYNETFGELSHAIKNRISHRGRALARALEYLTASTT